jgi:DNA-directed RNA polymerase subunit RPC12/RpoP
MSKLLVGIRFADHRVVCPKCAGITWLPVALVEVYSGGKTIATRVVSCDNCGYRRLRPSMQDGATSESHDL